MPNTKNRLTAFKHRMSYVVAHMEMRMKARQVMTSVLGLLIMLYAGRDISFAEGPASNDRSVETADPDITSALDEIQYPYLINEDGGVSLAGQINGVEIGLTIDKLNGPNIWSVNSPVDLGTLKQITWFIDGSTRGTALKDIIEQFLNTTANIKSSSNPISTNTRAGDEKAPFDINSIPLKYRDNASQTKAWLKEQEIIGETISFKVEVRSTSDHFLLVRILYEDLPPSFMHELFQAFPKNYSPLEYSSGEIYIMTCTPDEDSFGELVFYDASLISQ